jgi:hypothetical protein
VWATEHHGYDLLDVQRCGSVAVADHAANHRNTDSTANNSNADSTANDRNTNSTANDRSADNTANHGDSNHRRTYQSTNLFIADDTITNAAYSNCADELSDHSSSHPITDGSPHQRTNENSNYT